MSLQKNPTNQVNHHGRLSMRFENRGYKTVLVDTFQRPPLMASRNLYFNAARPSEATVYMIETSGGLLAGDQNDFQIDVEEGAEVCLIPQSATKIYPSFNGLWSSQNININIGPKARLSWKIEPVIPFERAKFNGDTVINMAKDSTLLWGEILAPGRLSHGEKFDYEHVRTNFQVWKDGECLIYDPLLFTPADADFETLGILEEHVYIGSLWFVAPSLEKLDIKKLNEKLQGFEYFKASASVLEGNTVNVRWLGSDLVLLVKEMGKLWEEFDALDIEV